MKYIYPAALAAAFLVVGGTWLLGTSNATTALATPPVEQAVAVPTTTVAPVGSSTGAVQASDTYTLAQVAAHNSANDCWTTINGAVYDLTPFIPMHPGGEQIVAICGIDGTSAFEAQHGGNRQANRELATLKIGTLINPSLQ